MGEDKDENRYLWLPVVSASIGVLVGSYLPDSVTQSNFFIYSILTLLVLSAAVIIVYTLRVSNQIGKEYKNKPAPASDDETSSGNNDK